jgi:hypothetical protein
MGPDAVQQKKGRIKLFEARRMAIRERKPQVSPLRLKITLFIAGVGPLLAVGLWLQSKGFFS